MNLRQIFLPFVAGLSVAGCAAGFTVDPNGRDGGQRYVVQAEPVRYRLLLQIDPREDTFSGKVEIDVTVDQATKIIAIHAEAMTELRGEVRARGGARPVTVKAGPHGGIDLHLADGIPAGPATIALEFEAPLDERPDGLYRVEDGGRWYAFTQFEPLAARKAFPSLDQPEHKTPYEVTLRVPQGMVGLTNTREVGRREVEGWTELRFEASKPLPTYLVAFAVGEFDVVEGEPIGDVPLRLVATRGKGKLASYALETTPPLLRSLESYFGRPYPYTKLDLVAVPNFGAGAMENVGLITFRERLLLFDGATAATQTKQQSLTTNAHELAHMWFGNLVTPRWWDDIWLNEAFATWMATKVVSEVHPEFDSSTEALRGTNWVMGLDTKKDARRIRNPIDHPGDIYNAFDGITYVKGRAVLSMLEAWLTADVFRAGVRKYINAHEHGNATTEDLMKALGEASGKPVWDVAQAFIAQAGVPLVDASFDCGDDGATLRLRQKRFLPTGSGADPGTPWVLPVCFSYDGGAGVERQCVELRSPAATFPLEACPRWLHPNAGETGYYRWRLGSQDLAALLERGLGTLQVTEKVALSGHLAALLEASQLPVATYLDALKVLAKETHPLVLRGVIDGLGTLSNRGTTRATRARFAALVRGLLAPHLERIGAAPRKGETPQTALLRPALLEGLADYGEDDAIRKRARGLTDKWLKDPASVAPATARWAVPMAAWDGDEAFWETLRDGIATAPDPSARVLILSALGAFGAPELLDKTLGLLVDGTLLHQDLRTVTRSSGRFERNRNTVWRWVAENYDAALGVLGPTYARYLPRFAEPLCTQEDRDQVAAFFAEPGRTSEGGDRNLGLALESIARCVAFTKRATPELTAYLR